MYIFVEQQIAEYQKAMLKSKANKAKAKKAAATAADAATHAIAKADPTPGTTTSAAGEALSTPATTGVEAEPAAPLTGTPVGSVVSMQPQDVATPATSAAAKVVATDSTPAAKGSVADSIPSAAVTGDPTPATAGAPPHIVPAVAAVIEESARADVAADVAVDESKKDEDENIVLVVDDDPNLTTKSAVIADSATHDKSESVSPEVPSASEMAPKDVETERVAAPEDSLVPLITKESADSKPASLSPATATADTDRPPPPPAESAAAPPVPSTPAAAAVVVNRPPPILRLPSPVGLKRSNSKRNAKAKKAKGRNVSGAGRSLILCVTICRNM